MKIYMITSGEYSDYGIDRLFLEEDKAYEWVRLHEECEIEERETSDEVVEIGKYKIYQYLSISYTDNNFLHKENISLDINKNNTLDYNDLKDFPYFSNYYSYSSYRGSNNINLRRLLPENFKETDLPILEEKYLKVCRDYMAKVKSYISEGFNEKQIKEMLFI